MVETTKRVIIPAWVWQQRRRGGGCCCVDEDGNGARNWRSWWYQPIRVAGHHSYSSPGRRGECSCDEWKMPSAKWLRRQAAPEMRAKEGEKGLKD